MLQLYLSSHQLLLIGPAFDAAMHRHHAAQLAVGLDGPLYVRSEPDAAWQQTPAFYVPPNVSHSFDARGSRCAMLYLDAESRSCVNASTRFGSKNIVQLAPDALIVNALGALPAGPAAAPSALTLCAKLLGEPITQAQRALDKPIQRVLAWVDQNLEQDIRLEIAATIAATSTSWLSHRFTQDIGVPLRRYVLWRRLRVAMEYALKGASLTEAAHAAGFSDSPHLTRTFRDFFGVTPSFLFGARESLHLEFLDTTG